MGNRFALTTAHRTPQKKLFEDFISREIVEQARNIFCNPNATIEWAEDNYRFQLGLRYY